MQTIFCLDDDDDVVIWIARHERGKPLEPIGYVEAESIAIEWTTLSEST